MTPLVSIIIPMYKVEHVLPNCFDCLRRQTYHRLELLFIDDCSPDGAMAYVEKNRQVLEELGMVVKLIHHDTNQGVATARNTGLDHATGEYIYSFDADDAIEPNAIERFVQRALLDNAEIVGCSWKLRYEGKDRSMTQPDVQTGREAYAYMCQGVMKWNLWLYLIKRELFESGEQIRFIPKQNMGEDMMVMCKLCLRSERMAIIHDLHYYYVKTNAEALTNKYTEAHWAQVDCNFNELHRYVHQYYGEREQKLLAHLILNLKLPLLISTNRADHQRWTLWHTEVNHLAMDNKMLPLRTRLLQLFAHYEQWWLVSLYTRVVMQWLYTILYK